MGICAYCKEESKLTKEHLIPSWYIREEVQDKGKEFFLERVESKFVRSDPQIKDVCSDCNNLKLGELDEYAKVVYLSNFFNDAFDGEKVNLNVNYEKFVRWLLKLSFNCARTHSSDVELLGEYAGEIIGRESLSPDIIVFSMLVAPTFIGEYPQRMARKNEEKDSMPPRWFRLGAFRIPDTEWFDWVFRHVLINGYCFFLAIPRKGMDLKNQKNQILAAMRQKGGGTLLGNGRAKLKRPRRHATEFFADHMKHFPTAYNLPEQDYISDIVKSKYDIVTYHIDKEDVEGGDISNALVYIDSLLRTRESLLACAGKVEFFVVGYDKDSRELWEIPEVRIYLSKLNEARPYWFLFQAESGFWLQALTSCLLNVKRTERGVEVLDPEKIGALMTQWFEGLNELSNKFVLSTEINRRLSDRAGYIVKMLSNNNVC
jgi:hypothetical protein